MALIISAKDLQDEWNALKERREVIPKMKMGSVYSGPISDNFAIISSLRTIIAGFFPIGGKNLVWEAGLLLDEGREFLNNSQFGKEDSTYLIHDLEEFLKGVAAEGYRFGHEDEDAILVVPGKAEPTTINLGFWPERTI